MKFIMELCSMLNKLKGFEAGYSTASKNSMIIEHEGKRFFVGVTEIESYGDLVDDIKIYCR